MDVRPGGFLEPCWLSSCWGLAGLGVLGRPCWSGSLEEALLVWVFGRGLTGLGGLEETLLAGRCRGLAG